MAEAGLGLMAQPGDEIELNGEGSSDPEGDVLLYTWTQTGGAPVELTDAETMYPRLYVPEDGSVGGTLRFSLVVNDGTSDSPPDTVEIVVPHQVIGSVATGCSATSGAPLAALAGVAACLAAARRRRG